MKTLVPVLIISMLAVPVWAQRIGQRVRVTTTYNVMVGTVIEKNLKDLSINLDKGGMIEIPFQNIRMMERSTGHTNYKQLGLLTGGLGGALVGVASARVDIIDCREGVKGLDPFRLMDLEDQCGRDNYTAKKAARYGLVLAAVGFAAGYLLEKETWEQMAIKTAMLNRPFLIRPQAQLRYRESGMMLSLATEFNF